MLRLTANKTKLYTLVADYVDNLPPMRKPRLQSTRAPLTMPWSGPRSGRRAAPFSLPAWAAPS